MKLKLLSWKLLKHTFLLAVSVLGSGAWTSLAAATELVYGIENEIKDYNITRSLDKNAFALSELVSEGLFYQRPDGNLVPDLVKTFKRVGRLWSFELRPSVFSTGKKLSCLDVQANIEEARLSPRPVRARLREIEKAYCLKETLVIETKFPYPQLLHRMGYIIRVYDASTLKDKNPVGSGPYVIQGKSGKDIILVPNPHFAQKVAHERIIFRTLRDSWLRDLAVLSGNVDFLMENFSLLRMNAFAAKPAVKIYKNPTQMLYYLVLKDKKYTREQRTFLREVLYREKVVERFWSSQVEASRKVFRETTLPKGKISQLKAPAPFSFEVSVVAEDSQINFLKFVAKILEPYNIFLKLRPLEHVSYMQRLNAKNFDAYFYYVDTSHAQNLEALFHSRGNRLDIRDPAFDSAFSKYAEGENKVELLSILNSLETRIFDEVYLIPLYFSFKELVAAQKLKIDQSQDGFWRDLLRSRKYTH